MHHERQGKTYAYDIETVSQGKRASDYTNNGVEYKAPSNYKDPEKIEKNIKEQKEKAKGGHGLKWWTGKVCSIAFVEIYGDDRQVFYGFDEAEVLLKATELLNHGSKIVGMSSEGFDAPFLVGRYMANGLMIPRSLKIKACQYDVNKFFGFSASSGQRGKLNDYAHGIGFKEKPLSGNKVQGIYDTALDAKMQGDELAEAGAWKQITEYNLHDCDAVKALTRAYYGSEGIG